MNLHIARLLDSLTSVSPLHFSVDATDQPDEIEIYPTNWGHRLRDDCSAARIAEDVAQAAADAHIRVEWLRDDGQIHRFRVMP